MSKAEEKAVARQFERLKIQHLAQEKFNAWLDAQRNPPAPPPTPPPAHQVASPAAAVAYGHIVMPPMEFAQASERERVLEHRRDMRALREDSGVCPPWGTGTRIQEFEAEERARYGAASELLRRGVADGHVAVNCHLEPKEVENIKKQIGL